MYGEEYRISGEVLIEAAATWIEQFKLLRVLFHIENKAAAFKKHRLSTECLAPTAYFNKLSVRVLLNAQLKKIIPLPSWYLQYLVCFYRTLRKHINPYENRFYLAWVAAWGVCSFRYRYLAERHWH